MRILFFVFAAMLIVSCSQDTLPFSELDEMEVENRSIECNYKIARVEIISGDCMACQSPGLLIEITPAHTGFMQIYTWCNGGDNPGTNEEKVQVTAGVPLIRCLPINGGITLHNPALPGSCQVIES